MDEAGAATVYHQRLMTSVSLLAGGLIILGFTTWALVDGHGAGIGIGVFAISIGARKVLAAIQTLRVPGRLIVAPDGLTLRCAGWSRRWLWTDIGPFKVMHGSGGPTHVAFSVHGLAAVVDDSRRPGISDIWDASLHTICRELNAARDRWGCQDADEVAPAPVTPYVG